MRCAGLRFPGQVGLTLSCQVRHLYYVLLMVFLHFFLDEKFLKFEKKEKFPGVTST